MVIDGTMHEGKGGKGRTKFVRISTTSNQPSSSEERIKMRQDRTLRRSYVLSTAKKAVEEAPHAAMEGGVGERRSDAWKRAIRPYLNTHSSTKLVPIDRSPIVVIILFLHMPIWR